MTLWLLFSNSASAHPMQMYWAELARANAHLNTLEEAPHYIALGIWDENWFELRQSMVQWYWRIRARTNTRH